MQYRRRNEARRSAPLSVPLRGPLRALIVCLLIPWLAVLGAGCAGEDGGVPAGGQQRPAGRIAASESPAQEAAASHILIAHRDSKNRPEGVTRSRKEAEELARQIAVLARRGTDFAELARKYSDDPNAKTSGGYLGIVQRHQLVPEFDRVLFEMEIGQVGAVVETEYGWHVVKRHPVRRVHAHHLLIAWREAVNVSGGVTRTQAQARNLADEVWRLAAAPDTDLCRLTRQYSDDPNNRDRCGDLGEIEPGFLPAAFDEALFRLRPGEISPVVQTDFGFHIIWIEDL